MRTGTKQLRFPFEVQKEPIQYDRIHRDLSTFKSGLAKEVHNWFRLTPSFGPDLVRHILEEFGYNNKSVVLDPFAGAATTLIECQLLNVKAYGFEINPFLHFVGKVSLCWDIEVSKLSEIVRRAYSLFDDLKYQFRNSSCEELPYEFPTIHNIYRWWRPDVLKDLLILKNAILKTCQSSDNKYKHFLLLCLAGVLVPDLTNVTLGKLQLHFIDRQHENILVLDTYKKHLQRMIGSLTKISKHKVENYATIFDVDSTNLRNINIEDKIDFVITSPPYANRYSYVWNTRPFLYFFDFFSTPSQASELDKMTIGGTWGTATSELAKGTVEPCYTAVEEIVSPVTEEIRRRDNLMANYLTKYFNLMVKQITEMDRLLSKTAKVAYVVGNSRLKQVYVETDVLLSKIFGRLNLNYSKIYINRFRKRNSGKHLFESVVYAEK